MNYDMLKKCSITGARNIYICIHASDEIYFIRAAESRPDAVYLCAELFEYGGVLLSLLNTITLWLCSASLSPGRRRVIWFITVFM
jgi:hypothetical protein